MKSLSAAEIKKDIRLVEKSFEANVESDRINSDDVLSSSFPVRPRKTTKWSKKFSQLAEEESDQEQNDEYLAKLVEFFRSVEKAHPSIVVAEKEFEALDIKYQVYEYFIVVHTVYTIS